MTYKCSMVLKLHYDQIVHPCFIESGYIKYPSDHYQFGMHFNDGNRGGYDYSYLKILNKEYFITASSGVMHDDCELVIDFRISRNIDADLMLRNLDKLDSNVLEEAFPTANFRIGGVGFFRLRPSCFFLENPRAEIFGLR